MTKVLTKIQVTQTGQQYNVASVFVAKQVYDTVFTPSSHHRNISGSTLVSSPPSTSPTSPRFRIEGTPSAQGGDSLPEDLYYGEGWDKALQEDCNKRMLALADGVDLAWVPADTKRSFWTQEAKKNNDKYWSGIVLRLAEEHDKERASLEERLYRMTVPKATTATSENTVNVLEKRHADNLASLENTMQKGKRTMQAIINDQAKDLDATRRRIAKFDMSAKATIQEGGSLLSDNLEFVEAQKKIRNQILGKGNNLAKSTSRSHTRDQAKRRTEQRGETSETQPQVGNLPLIGAKEEIVKLKTRNDDLTYSKNDLTSRLETIEERVRQLECLLKAANEHFAKQISTSNSSNAGLRIKVQNLSKRVEVPMDLTTNARGQEEHASGNNDFHGGKVASLLAIEWRPEAIVGDVDDMTTLDSASFELVKDVQEGDTELESSVEPVIYLDGSSHSAGTTIDGDVMEDPVPDRITPDGDHLEPVHASEAKSDTPDRPKALAESLSVISSRAQFRPPFSLDEGKTTMNTSSNEVPKLQPLFLNSTPPLTNQGGQPPAIHVNLNTQPNFLGCRSLREFSFVIDLPPEPQPQLPSIPLATIIHQAEDNPTTNSIPKEPETDCSVDTCHNDNTKTTATPAMSTLSLDVNAFADTSCSASFTTPPPSPTPKLILENPQLLQEAPRTILEKAKFANTFLSNTSTISPSPKLLPTLEGPHLVPQEPRTRLGKTRAQVVAEVAAALALRATEEEEEESAAQISPKEKETTAQNDKEEKEGAAAKARSSKTKKENEEGVSKTKARKEGADTEKGKAAVGKESKSKRRKGRKRA